MGQALRKVEHEEHFYETCLSDLTEKHSLRIDKDSFGGGLASFLESYFFEQGEVLSIKQCQLQTESKLSPQTLSDATRTSHASVQNLPHTERVLSFRGKVDYLNLPGAPVECQLRFLQDGLVQISLMLTLKTREQSAGYWQFRKSFPFMPARADAGSVFHDDELRAYVDDLDFHEAQLCLSNHTISVETYDTSLPAGMHVMAYGRLYGKLGIVQHMLGEESEVKLIARIHLPTLETNLRAEALEARLKRKQGEQVFPWDYSDRLPGVHATIALGEHTSIAGMRWSQPCLELYTPLDDWDQYDAIYRPKRGVRAQVDFAEGRVQVEAHAVLSSSSACTVFTRFEGLSVKNLSELSGLAGGVRLSEQLPDFVGKAVSAMEQFEVLELGFQLTGTSVTFATIKLGFRDLNWQLWKDHLVVQDLSIRFSLFGSKSPKLKATLQADTELQGIPVAITGSKMGSEYFLSASLESSQSLPLQEFFQRYAPGLPTPGNLTIDRLAIELQPGSSLSLLGGLASRPESWDIELGGKLLQVRDMSFELTKSFGAGGSMQGYFSGSLDMGGFSLQVNITLPKSLTLKARIPELSLKKMQKSLLGKALPGPKGFDLVLKDTQLSGSYVNGRLKIKALSSVPGVGMFAVQAGQTSDGWGAAIGLCLPKGKLSRLPGFSFMKDLEKVVSLEDLTLIVSSIDQADFRFPTSSQFGGNQARQSYGLQLPASPNGVTRGLNAHGTWVLKSSDKTQKLLKQVFSLEDSLPVTLQVKTSAAGSASVHMSTSIQARFDGAPLSAQLGVRLQAGSPPSFYVLGSGQIDVADHKMLLDLGVSVTLSGLALSGSLRGTLNLHGLKVSDLGVMGSINWAGLPGFGFAGRIDTKAFQSSVVVLLDSARMGLVCAGSVSELTAYKVLTSLTQSKELPKGLASTLKKIKVLGTDEYTLPKATTKALDAGDLQAVAQAFSKAASVSLSSREVDTLLVTRKKGQSWSVTNRRDQLKSYQLSVVNNRLRAVLAPQLYVCPSYARIGALEFQPGFFLSARLLILEFEAYARIAVNPSRGVAIDAYINKPLIIADRHFFCFSDVQGKKGPQLSLSTYPQPDHPVEAYRVPHFNLNGRLRVLGLSLQCLAQVTPSSLFIDTTVDLKSSVNTRVIKGRADFAIALKANVGKLSAFKARFQVAFDMDVHLYLAGVRTLHFHSGMDGYLELGMNKSKPYATLSVAFKLCGETCHATIKLHPNKDGLKDVGKFFAEDVSEFFTDIYADAERFVQDVGKGLLKGFEQSEKLAKTLAQHFTLPAEQVADACKFLGHGVEDIGRMLSKEFGQGAKDITRVLHRLDIAPQDIGAGLVRLGHGVEDVGEALLDIGESPKQIVRVFKDLKVKPKDIAHALRDMAIKPLDIVDTMSDIGISGKDLDRALSSIKINRASVEKALSGAVDDVEEFFDDIGKSISGLFSSKKKKKKKKKKASRKPTPDEIVKALADLTDNRDLIYQKITSQGYKSQDALKAILKLKGDEAGLIRFLRRRTGSDERVWNQLKGARWQDLRIAKAMRAAGWKIERMALLLKSHGYSQQRLSEIFRALKYPAADIKAVLSGLKEVIYRQASLLSSHKRFVRAEHGGGGLLRCDAKTSAAHEKFHILLVKDRSKQDKGLQHGCQVALMTSKRSYLRASKNGDLDAKSTKIGSAERFVLVNHTRKQGALRKGDQFSLLSVYGAYIVAEKDGRMRANRKKVGAWEKFRLQ